MSELFDDELPFAEMPEDTPTDDDGRYRIKNDQDAEWAIKKIREAEADKAFWKDFYDKRYQAVVATADLTISNMKALLHGFFGTVPHKVTKTQENYALPSGKLVFKKQEPEYERDDETILEWLEMQKGTTDYTKVKKSLDWSSFKKTVSVCGGICSDADGEVIPGLKAIEREDVFDVQLKKEEK